MRWYSFYCHNCLLLFLEATCNKLMRVSTRRSIFIIINSIFRDQYFWQIRLANLNLWDSDFYVRTKVLRNVLRLTDDSHMLLLQSTSLYYHIALKMLVEFLIYTWEVNFCLATGNQEPREMRARLAIYQRHYRARAAMRKKHRRLLLSYPAPSIRPETPRVRVPHSPLPTRGLIRISRRSRPSARPGRRVSSTDLCSHYRVEFRQFARWQHGVLKRFEPRRGEWWPYA